MSIGTVVTQGYGSFGSVNRIPTLGYGGTVTAAGYRSLFGFWLGGLCAPPSTPSVEGSLCICDLSFMPINEIDLLFTPMGFDDVSLIPVNDLDIEFTPPCDC